VVFQPVDVAENLKKQQANIPGIRPGKQTAEFIDHVMQRITFAGAMYVAFICVVPSILGQALRVSITFGGTSVMIVVGVCLDTVNQIEGHLLKKNYEGLTGPGGGRIHGRRLPAAT
jgi:preprotein translocase subunit SecY